MVPRLLCSLVVSAAACGDEPPPTCTTVDLACAPLYPPTFSNVYATTLAGKCGGDRVACHSDRGRAGGMSFGTEALAHAELRAPGLGRVVPGDAACSEMIVRTQGVGADYQMPPGEALTAEERCALVQWVAAGAPGPVVTTRPGGAP